MMVNMLGRSYQYANAPLSRVGQPMFGGAVEDLLKDLNYVDPTANQSSFDWSNFWTGLKNAGAISLDIANKVIDLNKAEADADTARALAKVQEELNAGKSIDQIQKEMSYTPFLIGGGVLAVGLVVTAILMTSGKRRR